MLAEQLKSQRLAAWVCTTSLATLSAGWAHSQNYPSKPIRIVTAEAGGGLDFSSRVIARALTDSVGQQVIVDNRGGGSGSIAAHLVAKAPSDGYTLLFYSSSFWLLPFMRDHVPYDPVKDYAPIALTTTSPNVFVTHPSVAASSVRDLIALAKAKPATLNYASSGGGSSTHLAAELFNLMAGVNTVHIPYKGGGPAVIDLVGGQVQFMIQTAPAVIPLIKSGKLKALAVTSLQPSSLVPGLPTVAATLPGYETGLTAGVYAPAKTPAIIISRLNQEIVRLLNTPAVKDAYFISGAEVVAGSPQQAVAAMKTEMVRMSKVIRDANIRAD